MANAVAAKKETAISEDIMDDMIADAGEGSSFSQDEMMMPFIRLAQKMSPQIDKQDAKFIKGLDAGDMFNTVSQEFFSGEKGINIIPCYHTVKYLSFVPREQGGGFAGELSPTDRGVKDVFRNDKGKDMLPDGNELVISEEAYVLIVEDDGSFQPAVLDMKSSQRKVSKRWKTNIAMQKIKNPKTGQLVTPAVFATMWNVSSVMDQNRAGEKYSNYKIEKVRTLGQEDRDLLLEAKAFRASIAAGEVKTVTPDNEGDSSVKGGGEPPVKNNSDDEIPF